MHSKKQAYTSFDETLEKIVRLLKSGKSAHVSGEEISSSLGISRAAVWKNIKKLRSLGYKISSKRKAGYKMLAKTGRMLPWEVSDGLQTEMLGRKIYYFDTIDSTQSFALRLATKPRENGSIVIAEQQTRGRGRQERKWVSPRGGIWLSVLLRPNFEISHVSIFPMLTSLALAQAVEKTLGLKPKLKWPNDVTMNGKKVAGILVDASIESNKIEYLVIGAGINFKVNPREISRSLKGSRNFYGVKSLVNKKSNAEPVKLLQSFLVELEFLYNKMIENNPDGIRSGWEKRSDTIGRHVEILTTTGKTKGKAVGIDKDGALLISSRGKTSRLLAGDVFHLS